ncbi:hypothetical protein GOP47_0008764 [Adiantum capillus-veneris]|uniref:Uncharacterized protein n=1 Tax=Adiantum capillus-veneris TaxID=13818 RepID=A0A9D4UZ71_ADICA|nr:hypothetical protein GOP47_0008764 [Adiantum capillus-veneris]
MDLNSLWLDDSQESVPSTQMENEIHFMEEDCETPPPPPPAVSQLQAVAVHAPRLVRPHGRPIQFGATSRPGPLQCLAAACPTLYGTSALPTNLPFQPHPPQLRSPIAPNRAVGRGTRLDPIPVSSDSNTTTVEGGSNNTPATTAMLPSSRNVCHPIPTKGPSTGRRVNWRPHEVIILVEAKKDLEVRIMEGGLLIRLIGSVASDRRHLSS